MPWLCFASLRSRMKASALAKEAVQYRPPAEVINAFSLGSWQHFSARAWKAARSMADRAEVNE